MNLSSYDHLAYVIIIIILLTAAVLKYLCDYHFKCGEKR